MIEKLINKTLRILESHYDFEVIEEILKTHPPKKGTVYVDYAEAFSVYKQLKILISELDGWDLGILIRLRQWASLYEKRSGGLPLERVNAELVSEVGWLKGGEEELQARLAKLELRGLVGHKGEGEFTLYFITDKGKEPKNYVDAKK